MARALQYVQVAHQQSTLLIATSHLESPLPRVTMEEVRTMQLAEGQDQKFHLYNMPSIAIGIVAQNDAPQELLELLL